VERLAGLCAPLQPRVIHLTGDADYLARQSIVERGADWEKQMIRQTEPTAYQKARGRTGIVTPPDVPLALLQTYVGDYAPVEAGETASTLIVQLEAGTKPDPSRFGVA
jgi:hypothetical protein